MDHDSLRNDIAPGRNLLLTTTTAPAPGVNGLAPRLSIAYGGGWQRQRVDRDDPADILDRTTRQYGNTADSRLRVAPGVNYAWSVNRETDAFGNAMTFEYHAASTW